MWDVRRLLGTAVLCPCEVLQGHCDGQVERQASACRQRYDQGTFFLVLLKKMIVKECNGLVVWKLKPSHILLEIILV